MEEIAKRKLIARLRRLSGQSLTLERLLSEDDAAKFVTQLEAVIAAARAALAEFARVELVGSTDQEKHRLLERLIRKS